MDTVVNALHLSMTSSFHRSEYFAQLEYHLDENGAGAQTIYSERNTYLYVHAFAKLLLRISRGG